MSLNRDSKDINPPLSLPIATPSPCGAGHICKSQRTLDGGRETGSKAKLLIRRSCNRGRFSAEAAFFNVSTSLPSVLRGICCEEMVTSRESIVVGSISWSTEANRTARVSSGFLDSGGEEVMVQDSTSNKRQVCQNMITIKEHGDSRIAQWEGRW